LAVVATLALAGGAAAADKTWDNGSSNFTWDTTSANWSGSTWSAAGDSALFTGLGTGTITVPGAINVGSINVSSGAYTLAGSGSLTIAPGAGGTQVPSTILVDAAAGQFSINVPLASSIGLYKNGGGVLQLGAPVTFTGTTPIIGDAVNLQIGLTNSGASGFPIGGAGEVELTAANVLPTNASVAIGNGWLNLGSFNTTIGRLVYMNTVASGAYGPNGNNGVFGTGTLKVTGPIIAQYNLGQAGFSNTLAANLDMNGGTQQFLLNTVQTSLGYTALHVTGVLSNGSLFKGWTGPQPGGIGLYANNTYTGSTTISGSTFGGNVVAGTNASTSLTVVNAAVTLFGANGSYGAATSVNVVASGGLILDNNASSSGTNAPMVAAANNGNRLNDAAAVTLSGSTLRLNNLSGQASSETYGSLHTARGFNVVTTTAAGAGGSNTLIATGAWTQGPRAVTQFSGTLLGTSSVVKFGSTPAAVGGLIPQAYGSNSTPFEIGFVKYDPTNGITLLSVGEYQTAFGSGGNVTLAANAGPIDTQTINALRSTATTTVSFNPGSTLTVTSGQILAASTLTLDAATPNGTIAFGSVPATMLTASTINVNAPITGTAGLIKAGNSTLNVNGSLAGLSGPFTHASGTTTLNVPYADDIDVVGGTFNLRANLTTAGKTITLGNPDTPANTVGFSAGLNIQSTAVTTIAANLVVANGTNPNPTSFTATISQQGGTAGIVQEIQGAVTLNGPLSILGGGNTVNTLLFSGPLSGPGAFRVQNGTIRFTSTATNYNGPFILGNGGNTSLVTFDGTNASTTGTMTIGFGTGAVTSTRVRLSNPNAIPGGQITMLGGTLQPTASMTLPNAILLSGPPAPESSSGAVDVGAGLAVNLAGPLTSEGQFFLSKVGTGMLTLSAANTYTGGTTVSAGTLRVANTTGSGTGTGAVAVNTGGTLDGTGTIAGAVNLNDGGTIQGGTGGSATATNTLSLPGGVQLDGANSIRVVVGDSAPGNAQADPIASRLDLGSAVLSRNTGGTASDLTTVRLVAAVDSLDGLQPYTATIALFGSTSNLAVTDFAIDPNPTGFHFFNTPSLSLTGNMLTITFTPTPEPAFVLLACGAAAVGLAWRRHRTPAA
jgi:autotransporter-associated beta strand protein